MANLDDYKPRDTSKGYSWIQVRTNLLDEPEYMQLSGSTKAIYFEAYILAGRSDAGGLIIASDKPATVDKLAWLLRRSIDELQKGLDELQTAGFVDLQGGHVTVCRFASEQGPSMAKQREQWALRQAKRRARAKGEAWTDEPGAEPEQDTDTDKNEKSDEVKELNQESDQEKIKNQTKTKRVTDTSRDNHAIVTRDSGGGGLTNEYGSQILSHWLDKTGKNFKLNSAFLDMVQRLIDAGVSIEFVDQAIEQTKDTANTPMYLEPVAMNLKNASPQATAQKRLDGFRAVYNQNKAKSEGE